MAIGSIAEIVDGLESGVNPFTNDLMGFFLKGMSDEEDEMPQPSRMDESAYITALAKRVAGTDAKVSKSANKSIADIRKLAGL
jgi:hypothetical protein